MARDTLYNKILDLHKVRRLPDGQWQIAIGLHLIHEVTSPQAFAMLKQRGLKVAHPELTYATADHIVPTDYTRRPLYDSLAEEMLGFLERNCKEHGITLFGLGDPRQGIVHIIGPELGLTQPGKTIVCGDSHTSTHGAFGAIAFGIGTTQVAHVLATQSLAVPELKVRRIEIDGALHQRVYAKDIILKIISTLGVGAGAGYAYEYGGEAIDRLSMEERMTICNMTIEGSAIAGYVNPDKETIEYLRGREFSPSGGDFERRASWWMSLASGKDAKYDDVFELKADELSPMVTWGTNPGQAIGISEDIPEPRNQTDKDALFYMKFKQGEKIAGKKIDVVFLGSCTNSRLSDLEEASRVIKGRKVAPHVKAFVVPGSAYVKKQAEEKGINNIFTEAGFEWRGSGCSMCLGMNPDKLVGDQICASTSNRNYRGRQGSPTGRTILMSPAMAAAAAIAGEIIDIRAF
ncbi:MAG: 3-isopropylmalate dehydratase large subunit [Candidatus Jacksonbacteria bacterium]|nr:3-isopropylmalate dehydratase large subunit [Candidatus Jacksonbacteria bacterium]